MEEDIVGIEISEGLGVPSLVLEPEDEDVEPELEAEVVDPEEVEAARLEKSMRATEAYLEKYGYNAWAEPENLSSGEVGDYEAMRVYPVTTHVRWGVVKSIGSLVQRVRDFVEKINDDVARKVFKCFLEGEDVNGGKKIFFAHDLGLRTEKFDNGIPGLVFHIWTAFDGELRNELFDELSEISFQLMIAMNFHLRVKNAGAFITCKKIYLEMLDGYESDGVSEVFFKQWLDKCEDEEERLEVFEYMKKASVEIVHFLNMEFKEVSDLDGVMSVLRTMAELDVDPNRATLGSIVKLRILNVEECECMKKRLSDLICEYGGGDNAWGVRFYSILDEHCRRMEGLIGMGG